MMKIKSIRTTATKQAPTIRIVFFEMPLIMSLREDMPPTELPGRETISLDGDAGMDGVPGTCGCMPWGAAPASGSCDGDWDTDGEGCAPP